MSQGRQPEPTGLHQHATSDGATFLVVIPALNTFPPNRERPTDRMNSPCSAETARPRSSCAGGGPSLDCGEVVHVATTGCVFANSTMRAMLVVC